MENKDSKRLLSEEELDKVAGGFDFKPLSLDFDACTRKLKEAGDRAWACMIRGMLGSYCPLFDAINSAEHSTNKETRFIHVKKAWEKLANGPENVIGVNFKTGDYEYIKERVDEVYNALKILSPHIMA